MTFRRQAEVETQFGKPLVRVVCDLFNEGGLRSVAGGLHMPVGTAWYWVLRLGIRIQRVAVSPGETVHIFRQAPPTK